MEAVNTEIIEGQSASDDIGKEISAEQTEEQKTQEEEEKRNLQIEKSRLGQKVKRIESVITDISSKFDILMEKMNERPQTEVIDSDDENFVTKKEVKKLYQNWQKEMYDYENRARTEYENKYLSHLKNYGTDEDEDDLHSAIIDEVMKNPKFNVRHSNDPVSDAERNYLKAKLYVLNTNSKDRKIPIGGKKPNAPLGVGGDTHLKEKDEALPKLDPDAAEFVKKMGLSDDFVKKALKGDAPNYLKRK